MGTSGNEGRSTSRKSVLTVLRERSSALTAKSHIATSAGIIALTVAVTASGALASTGDTEAKKTAVKAHKPAPSYLQPVGTLVKHGQLPKPALGGDTGNAGVPNGTTPAPTVLTTTVPAGDQDISAYQGAAGTLTPAGIATLALQNGCPVNAAPVATAIAMAESGGSPSAQGDITLMTPTWDWSAGLWQIRGLRAERNSGDLRDSVANQNATKNASAMYFISSGCTDWTPWSTYTNGAYLRFMGIADQAVRYVYAYYLKHGNTFPTVAAPDPTAVIPVGGGGAAPQAQAQASSSAAPMASKPKPHRSAAASKTAAAPSAGRAAKSSAAGGKPANPAASTSSTNKPAPTLPVKLPTPTKTKLPTTLPVPLPTITLPGLP